MWGAVFRPVRFVTRIAWMFLVGCIEIVIVAQVLSWRDLLADSWCWAVALLLAAAVPAAIAWTKHIPLGWGLPSNRGLGKNPAGQPLPDRAILSFLGVTVIGTSLLTLIVIVGVAPYIWDNLVTRLPRVAYWLQRGNMGYYDANMYTQVLAQKNFEILLLFTFLASGLRENLVGLVQFVSYWTALVMVYGITWELGRTRASALFSALVFGLLPQVLLQSGTANSDLFLAALLAILVYSLLVYGRTGRSAHLVAAAAAVGLGAGTKASIVLAAPSLAVVAAYALLVRPAVQSHRRRAGLLRFGALTLVALAVLALPSGYLENWEMFGHPMGDEAFRKINSVEGKTAPAALEQGLSHLAATGLDFLSLDGFLPVFPVPAAQRAIRYIPRLLIERTGLPLESREGDNWYYDKAWYFDKPPVSHPDYSYWGILGFALVWPAVFLSLFGVVGGPGARVLAAAALIDVAVFAFSGASWGHYVIYAAVFAVPTVGCLFPPRRWAGKAYVGGAALLGCLAAFMAVLFQYRNPIWFDQARYLKPLLDRNWAELMPLPTRTDSVFRRDRLGQMLRDAPLFEPPVRKFEELVPPGATVAVCLNPHSFEYPLFGEKLSRRLIPINSFRRGLQPIPGQADYLLWADDFDEIFHRTGADIHLGKDWWLRKLK
ncbi:MAG TPA: hypothetical protein PLI51_00560 [bacterium]|nr:hypothetical protein [bacterium]HPQ65203.1 hypothetical protein [bacterium]